MSNACYICRTNSACYLKNARKIFSDSASLQSERALSDVLSEVLEKEISEQDAHSNLLCIRCANMVMEYDLYQSKIKTLKTKLQLEWIKGEKSKNVFTIAPTVTPAKKDVKKIVLPASKLQPLPANFVFNAQSLQNATQNQKAMPRIVKVTSTPVTSTQTAIQTNIGSLSSKIITNALKDENNQTLPKTTNSLMTLNLESLPSDFMASLSKVDDQKNISEQNDAEQNDEMEIDEECTVTVVPISSSNDISASMMKSEQDDSNNGDDYLALNVIDDKDGSDEVIFSEFDVVDGDENNENNDQHTLVVDGTNSDALLRLMVGQKLMYGDKQISIVMNDNDNQDSNDEDIELQMSGDEETANAIIAAQEQGGSFIKLESGEMLQVQCIQSKPAEEIDSEIINIVRKESNGSFTCLLCPHVDIESNKVNFTSQAEEMMQHLKTAHSARIYICGICGFVVRKRSEFSKHMDEHKGEMSYVEKGQKYECEQCNKKFLSKSLLAEHTLIHAGVKMHTCKMCQKSFASKYTLQAHMKTHTIRPRPYSCDQCTKTFMTPQNLNQHLKTHSSVKSFVCRICDKAFGTQHSLEVHGVVHSGKRNFVCDTCEKGFARKQELVDHIRVHTGERPFTCSECGASFAQRSNLHSHKRHTHTDDRRYACQHCTKRFKRRRLLEYHIKSRHTGERPLACDVCGATFVYPEHYRKHKLVHSGAKPFVCEICGKSFNSRDNRNTHRFVHSDKKPYECVVCGSGYMRKHALYSHMHQSGHLAETIVVNQPRVENVSDKVILDLEGGSDLECIEENEQDKNDSSTGMLTYNIQPDQIKSGEDEDSIVNNEAQAWEDGMIRIVEIQLPNGNNGWVAINS